MEDDRRRDIALFKYGLIAPLIHNNGRGQKKYFRELASKEHIVPHIGKKSFKAETFKSWLRSYRRGGFDALIVKIRIDRGNCRKINDALAIEIKEMVNKHPLLSCAALYRILIAQGKIDVGYLTEQTLRKYINDNNLKESNTAVPRKKFEMQHVNDLWIADAMHGPYIKCKGKKCKVFLIAAIDDNSRVIPARGWFFHENSISLEIALKEAISRHGLPKALYCDNGSLFSSSHLQLACARLGIALIHSRPYDSPSRGKIERFYRTVRQKFLPFTDFSEIGDIDLLNVSFERWLEKEYHKHYHHGIGTRPMDKFMEGIKHTEIKRITEQELDMAFQITITRKVKNDSTVSINAVLYECPTEFIGKKVQIRYPSDKPEDLTIYVNDKPVSKLNKLNIHENASPPSWQIRFNKEDKDD
ncbi:MAG: DDE-type integrase/transposase/recombinase [Colwellia sp.]|nr:DDE-type integrase/transposase/recombinase [Colwellia sp.]